MQTAAQMQCDHPLPPHIERNAQLIGLLLFFSKVMDDMRLGHQTNDADRFGDATCSLLAHAVGVYGHGANLQMQTVALATELGFNVEIVDARHCAQA